MHISIPVKNWTCWSCCFAAIAIQMNFILVPKQSYISYIIVEWYQVSFPSFVYECHRMMLRHALPLGNWVRQSPFSECCFRLTSFSKSQSCLRKPGFGKIARDFRTIWTASAADIFRREIRKASTKVADRLTPSLQCTKTLPVKN